VENILVRLLEVAEGNVGRAEWGIVYLDEVDKLARSPEMATNTATFLAKVCNKPCCGWWKGRR